MKIVWSNAVTIVFFGIYNYLCLASSHEPTEKQATITLGALVDAEHSAAMVPLYNRIERENIMQYAIKYKINPKDISFIDSFKSSKILCQMFQGEGGLAGIFGPISLQTLPITQRICTTLEVPHIQMSWRPSATYAKNHTVLNFYPDPQLLSQGLAVIVKNLRWNSFVLLYENDDGLIRLQDVLKLQNFEDKRNSIRVKQLQPGPDNRRLLKEVKNSSITNIILDCETDHVMNILKQAKELGLLENYYDIFLTTLDAHTLDLGTLNSSANISTVRIIDLNDPVFQNVVLNWQEYIGMRRWNAELFETNNIRTESALMHDAADMFISAVNALHETQTIVPESLSCSEISPWKDGLRIASFLKKKHVIKGATGPINFDESGRRINFTLYLAEGPKDRVIARWSPDNMDEIILTRNKSEIYEETLSRVTKGSKIIVSSRLGEPYLRKRKPSYEGETLVGNNRYEGYSMDLIRGIAEHVGFEFEFQLTKDEKYQSLIDDIQTGKAQLAICDLTITHQRREKVDFSLPFMTLGISILYKKDQDEPVNMFGFLDPFSVEVWIYSATLYLAVSVILYFVSRMAPGDWENPHPCDQNPEELENIWDLKNCLWLTLGSIMTQGCDILPKGISSRMTTSMWWFFSLIMTSSYTANLAAFLTKAQNEGTIDSAEDLAKQTKIKYGTLDGGATQSFFRDSNYSTYQRMWNNMASARPSVFVKDNSEGVNRVVTNKQGTYAFLMESSQIEYVTETICELKQVGNNLDSKGYGIAMPIDYPLRSAINKAILKLQEDGKLSEYKTKWWKVERVREKDCTEDAEGTASAKLALANVGGVFLVLGVGIAIAFVIAIGEFLWNVRNVSVEEHLTYWQAFKTEIRFALNIWVTKKKTKVQISEGSSSHSGDNDNKSIAHSMLRGAESFLNIGILSKIGTPDRRDE